MAKQKLWFGVGLWVIAVSCVAVAQQQKNSEPASAATVLEGQLKYLESEFVPTVDAMPEDKFTFAPTTGEFKGVRNFGAQARHVAAVNYIIGAAILDEKPPAVAATEDGPATMISKADIMKFVKDSFDYSHKALNAVNEKNMTTPISSPFGEGNTTRLGMSVGLIAHARDHYGQMVEYLRMNGIIPPASRPAK
jgi:hypothetical protein